MFFYLFFYHVFFFSDYGQSFAVHSCFCTLVLLCPFRLSCIPSNCSLCLHIKGIWIIKFLKLGSTVLRITLKWLALLIPANRLILLPLWCKMQQPCGFVTWVLTSMQYNSLALRPGCAIISGLLIFYIIPKMNLQLSSRLVMLLAT